jgi:hypothetical protein
MGLFRRFIKILGVIFACVKTFIVAIFTVRGYSPKARQKAALVTCQWAQRICKIINLKVQYLILKSIEQSKTNPINIYLACDISI